MFVIWISVCCFIRGGTGGWKKGWGMVDNNGKLIRIGRCYKWGRYMGGGYHIIPLASFNNIYRKLWDFLIMHQTIHTFFNIILYYSFFFMCVVVNNNDVMLIFHCCNSLLWHINKNIINNNFQVN
jgi:hypothetical protein